MRDDLAVAQAVKDARYALETIQQCNARLADRVFELRRLLVDNRLALSCKNLHHEKNQYHSASDPCPVEAEIDRIIG